MKNHAIPHITLIERPGECTAWVYQGDQPLGNAYAFWAQPLGDDCYRCVVKLQHPDRELIVEKATIEVKKLPLNHTLPSLFTPYIDTGHPHITE